MPLNNKNGLYFISLISYKQVSVSAHLQVILLTGVQSVAAEVRLELYVIFKGLIGGREGHRGEKLNSQNNKTKQKGREQVPNRRGKETTEYDKRRENGIKSVKRSEFKGKQSLFSVIRYSAVYRERLLS